MTSNCARAGAHLLLLALWVGACAPLPGSEAPIDSLAPVPLTGDERLQVAATTSIVADILRQVGGDDIHLTLVLPTGVDPHDYTPTPRELLELVRTDVIFLSGLGLEATLEQAMADAGLEAPRVSLSEGLEETSDPHVWLDPTLVADWVENARKALSALDPAHAAEYAARAEAYRGELEALDGRLVALVSEVPPQDRKFVSEHEMMSHLADHFGLRVVGSLIPSTSSAAEPSSRALADLQATMEAEGVRVIVVSASSSADLARTVAADHGGAVVRIYVESLSEPGGPADSYLRLMEYNLAAIVAALRP